MDKNIHGGHPYMCEDRYALEHLHAFMPCRLVIRAGYLVAILPPLRRYITTAPSHFLIRESGVQ